MFLPTLLKLESSERRDLNWERISIWLPEDKHVH